VKRSTFMLRVRAEPGVDDVIRSLRAWLKLCLRTFGLRCVSIEEVKQKGNTMDMKKYAAGLILPEHLHGGPRREVIINVYVSDKHDCPVLVFESGNELFAWRTIAGVLARAYGYDSEDWKGHAVELSLGTYVDKKDGQTKETVILKAISQRESGGNSGEVQRADPAKLAKDLDDQIPF
jgi:hypothetical protein